jgi:hypothetical protein
MSKFLSVFLLLLVCSFGSIAWAMEADKPADPGKDPGKDVLVFANGDQLTGTLVRTAGGNVTFKSDMAGEITIPWARVKELRTAGRFAVLEKGFKEQGSRKLNDAHIPQGTITMQDQIIAVQGDAGPPQTVSTKDTEFVLDNATYEKDLRGQPGFLAGWNGALTGGATLVRATQNTETFTGAINLVRLAPTVSWLDPRTRDLVNVLETYGSVTQTNVPSVKTSIFHADGEHDIYYSPRAYALGNISFDHNLSQGLDLQQIYGAGIGLTLLKKPNQQLDIKAQAQYETQNYGLVPGTTPGTPTTPDTHLIAATFAENYMRKYKTLTFTEQIQLIPAFNVLQDYSAVAQAGVVFALYKRLSFTVNGLDTFLNDPASGAQKNSFQLVTGITYKLK